MKRYLVPVLVSCLLTACATMPRQSSIKVEGNTFYSQYPAITIKVDSRFNYTEMREHNRDSGEIRGHHTTGSYDRAHFFVYSKDNRVAEILMINIRQPQQSDFHSYTISPSAGGLDDGEVTIGGKKYSYTTITIPGNSLPKLVISGDLIASKCYGKTLYEIFC